MNRLMILCLVCTLALPAFANPHCGDVNADGQTNILDALGTAQFAAGIVSLPMDAQLRADVNSDTIVSVVDALLLAQRVAGQPVSIVCVGMGGLSSAPPPPPPTDKVYVATNAGVEVFDQATAAHLTTLPFPAIAVEADPIRDRIYVASGASLLEVDSTTDIVVDTHSITLAGDMEVTPDGTALVAISTTGVAVIDLPAMTIRHSIATGPSRVHEAIAITPDSLYAWRSHSSANTIVKIDLSAGTIAQTVTTGNTPYGLDVIQGGTQVVVVNFGDVTMSRFEASTGNEILPRQPTGTWPMAVLGHSNGDIYVVNCLPDLITEHDGATGQSQRTLPVGSEPIDFHECSAGQIAVVNSFGSSVSLVDPQGTTRTLVVGGLPKGVTSK